MNRTHTTGGTSAYDPSDANGSNATGSAAQTNGTSPALSSVAGASAAGGVKSSRGGALTSASTNSTSGPASGTGTGVASLEKGLDIYAAVYVPAWLKAINEAKEFEMVPLRDGGETAATMGEKYAEWFLPKHLLEERDAGWFAHRENQLIDVPVAAGGAKKTLAPVGDGSTTSAAETKTQSEAEEADKVEKEEEIKGKDFGLQSLDRDAWLPKGIDEDDGEELGGDMDDDDDESKRNAEEWDSGKVGADEGWKRSVGAVPDAPAVLNAAPSQLQMIVAPSPGDGAASVIGDKKDAQGSNDNKEGKRIAKIVPPLAPTSYADHFLALLQLESDAKSAQLARHAMYRVKLARYRPRGARAKPNSKDTSRGNGDSAEAAMENLFVINIPGLREEQPKLRIGDMIHLRPIFYERKTWFKQVLEARVWALRAVAGQAILRCDGLEQSLVGFGGVLEKEHDDASTAATGGSDQVEFNVTFINPTKEILDADVGLRRIGEVLKAAQGRLTGATVLACKRWFFPDEADFEEEQRERQRHANGSSATVIPVASASKKAAVNGSAKGGKKAAAMAGEPSGTKSNEIKYFDSALNEEQKQAVDHLSTQHPKLPYLISESFEANHTQKV